MENILHKILAKKMDRREFLIFLGAVSLSFIGLPHILESVTKVLKIAKPATKGYGSSPYGGLQEGKF